ncbi:MAG: Fe-S cluster assembly protein SufD [Nitratireductor sp.]
MNVHATPQMTAAEQALIDAYGQRFSDLPGDTAVVVRRDEAVEALKSGLPTRRVEAWHYTDLRRLLSAVPAFDPALQAKEQPALLSGATVLPVLSGRVSSLPRVDGVALQRMFDRLSEGSVAAQLFDGDAADAIGAINTAFVADGYALDIAEDAEIAKPIELQNLHEGGQAHVRFAARAGRNSRATIVERQTGVGAALVSAVSHITVEDGADLTWIILQEQPDDATFLGQTNIEIGADAKLTLFFMNAGGKLVRQEVKVNVAGEGSEFVLRGVNLLAGETHCDVTMVLDHQAANTVSTEVIRNIVTDKAKGVFQGQIRVAREAQKTDAKMACNTLLLTDEGEFSAKPELEIFADDVACGHGATVTEIDHGHLFYLMARGIDEKTARGLLVRAFLAEVIEDLDNEALVEALEEKLTAWFTTHG